MAGDVRSLLRAAQEAEGRGEIDEAAQILRRAAGICEDSGKPARALQLLRYAVRLRPEAAARVWLERLEAEARAAVQDEPGDVRVLEFPAEVSLEEAVREATVHALGFEAEQGPWIAVRVEEGAEPEEEGLDEPFNPRQRFIEERGPTLAPAGLEAWCSFCCRPRRETGALVAGPAGAFLCVGCLAEAGRLLGLPVDGAGSPGGARDAPPQHRPAGSVERAAARGGEERERASGRDLGEDSGNPAPRVGASVPAPQVTAAVARSSVAPGPPGARELLLEHHSRVLTDVELALREGRRCVLMLGPQGSGRSTCLNALDARLPEAARVTSFATPPEAGVWLLDDPEELDASEWRLLSRALADRPGVRLVITARADRDAPSPLLTIAHASGVTPLWSTRELLLAAPGLPAPLASRVDEVISISLPAEDALRQLACSMLLLERPQLLDPGGVARRLTTLALASEGGLHELVSLVQRIPRGEARLSAPRAGRAVEGTKAKAPLRTAGPEARAASNPVRVPASRVTKEQRAAKSSRANGVPGTTGTRKAAGAPRPTKIPKGGASAQPGKAPHTNKAPGKRTRRT